MRLEDNLNKILIVDFGSQFTQLIARKIRELGIYCEIISHNKIIKKKNLYKNVKGLILSGGPLNVYQDSKVKFNKKIIDSLEKSKVLSSTEFIPCPNGFFHPETYRLYEALECGCIPIVENAFQYYERLFPNNPFIKVDKWIDAKSIIKDWNEEQINKKRKECQLWWHKYQKQLQEDILNKIKL